MADNADLIALARALVTPADDDDGLLYALADALEAASLCAICTPERDHNGVFCRRHANERLEAAEAVREAATALYERVEMDESVGICLSSRVEALNLGAALRGDG